MEVSTTPRVTERALADVRSTRHAQRRELARVSHWRRLVRARMDLIVAAAVVPGPLGAAAAEVPTSHASANLPDFPELVTSVRCLGAAEMDRLHELRDVDRRLESYEATVAHALSGSTEEFIRRLTMNPTATLRGRRPVG